MPQISTLLKVLPKEDVMYHLRLDQYGLYSSTVSSYQEAARSNTLHSFSHEPLFEMLHELLGVHFRLCIGIHLVHFLNP